MRPLLALVDLQNDYLAAAGLEPGRGVVVERAARLLSGIRALGLPVVHVVTAVDPSGGPVMPHWEVRGVRMCVRGTAGVDSPPPLRPREGEAVVEKVFFSGFSRPGLQDVITRTGTDTLVLAGVHLHACVRATALDAYQRGLTVWVAEEAVASDDPLKAAAARAWMEGRVARFVPVDEILACLSGGDVPRGRSLFVHRAPARTAETLFTVPAAEPAEVDRAVSAAQAAGREWRARSAGDRAAVLMRVAEILERDAAGMALRIAVDAGKPIVQAEAEVARSTALFREAARSSPLSPWRTGPRSSARRRPLGVVAVITPWNEPLGIPAGKIAPALFLGNTIVFKPALAGTRIAMDLARCAREAGLPDGALSLVAGDQTTGAAVAAASGVDAVTLSGSSLTGWSVQEICGRRRIPFRLELGANNGAIVWGDTDLQAAARRVTEGAFCFSGQRCTANRRVIVEAAVAEPFLGLLTGATRRLGWGDPLLRETRAGPVISEAARDRIAAIVDRARPGASLVLAPHGDARSRPDLTGGAYYPPTLVVCDEPAAEIVQEETFGPVLVVQPARTFDEALALLDGVRQGHVAALFSPDPGRRRRFLEEARAGILKLDRETADVDAVTPFGGWKQSGLGPPEHGPGDSEFYTRAQAVYGEELV